MKKYIEERPSFQELHSLATKVEELALLVEALADDNDVAQRATDLQSGACNFADAVRDLVTTID